MMIGLGVFSLVTVPTRCGPGSDAPPWSTATTGMPVYGTWHAPGQAPTQWSSWQPHRSQFKNPTLPTTARRIHCFRLGIVRHEHF
jgi:hypothetical protein